MALPENLLKIIKDKNIRLENIPADFVSRLDKVQLEVLQRVTELLAGLKSKGGSLIISRENLAIADEINLLLPKVLTEGEYIRAVADFANQFDKQALVNDKYFSKAFPGYARSEISETILLNAKKNAIEFLIGTPTEAAFIEPIKQIINNAVVSGSSLTDLIQGIREFAVDDKKLQKHAGQIAYDSFALSDRQYSKTVADDLGLEWFFYSGGLMKTSRCFCQERDGHFYSKDVVESWAELDWQGKMPGTNAQTIFSTAGGFRCQHSIMGVSEFAVEEPDTYGICDK